MLNFSNKGLLKSEYDSSLYPVELGDVTDKGVTALDWVLEKDDE